MLHRLRARRSALLRVAAGLLLALGLLALPDLGPDPLPGYRPVTALHGRIESVESTVDPAAPGLRATVLLLEGPQAGSRVQAYLVGPGGSQLVPDYRPGEDVLVSITASPTGGEPFTAVTDRWRLPALGGLVLLFVAVVVLVGSWHGIRALLALGLTIGAVLKILVPLVLRGVAPLPLAVVVATAVTVVTILLTEGPRRASIAAILGTAAALALTGLLGAAATDLLRFAYTPGSDLAFVPTADGAGLDLRGALLAAFVLGAAGVLDDVTVTQAAVVQELAARPGVRRVELVRGALSVGRSHIAATVNTLFLAYVGTGLPLLALVLVNHQPANAVLNDEVVATEVVRTLVGSIGVVAAMPLTTLIAVWLLDGPAGVTTRVAARRTWLLAGGIAALVVALVALPFGGPGRPAMNPGVFVPGGSPAATPGPSGSGDGGAGGGAEARIGTPVQVAFGGVAAGTLTVDAIQVAPAAGGQRAVTADVTLRATADAAWPARWSVLVDDRLVDATASPGLPANGLRRGDVLAIRVTATVPATAIAAHLVFADTTAARVIAITTLPLGGP